MPGVRNDGVRLIAGERLVDHFVGAVGVEFLTHDNVESPLQEPLYQWPAGVNIHIDHDARITLLHARDGHWDQAGSGMSDRAYGGLARKP